MTESSPTPAPDDFDLNSIHAVVEWLGADGQKRYLYQPDQDPSRQITLGIHFSAGSGAALLKLEEFVEEEVTAAEGRVLQRVREANWTVSIEE
ncbi:hypothetical protein ONZ43_g7552 [Nemania bipapillata]|uniref:Uncharacterized protein n=1 Tax=Nemania bipapillata TaxID=110536 RepID=A0ACC2HPZ0_9PEZI|nr:hypothetical protein ONZ43_g7552 [Nemania bipapillata]